MSKPTDEKQTSVDTPKEYTKQELAKMKGDTIKFYKDQVDVLKIEHQFYDLKASIEEAKARELQAIAVQGKFQMAQEQAAQTQVDMGDDGFPKEWSAEEKAEYLKANPEYEKHLAEMAKEQAAQAKAEKTATKKPAAKRAPAKKRELKSD